MLKIIQQILNYFIKLMTKKLLIDLHFAKTKFLTKFKFFRRFFVANILFYSNLNDETQ